MQSSLLKGLADQITPGLLGAIGSATGAKDTAIATALQTAAIAVLGGLAKQAGSAGGLAQLRALIGDRLLGEGMAGHLGGLLANSPSPVSALVAKTLGFAFGDKQSAVVSQIAAASGLMPAAASSVLNVAAPLALGALSDNVRRAGGDASALGKVLHSESSALLGALPPSIIGTLGIAGLRDVLASAAAAPAAAAAAAPTATAPAAAAAAAATTAADAARHVAAGVGAAAVGAAAGLGSGALDAARSVGSGVGQAVGSVAGGVAGGAVEAVKHVGVGVGQAVGSVVSGTAGGVVDAAKTVAGSLGAAAGSLAGGITGATDGGVTKGVIDAAKHVAGGVGSAAVSVAGGVAAGTVDAAKDLAGGVGKAVVGAASGVGRGAVEAVKDVGGGVGSAAASVAGGVVGGTVTAAKELGGGIGRAAGSVAAGVSGSAAPARPAPSAGAAATPKHGGGGSSDRHDEGLMAWWPMALLVASIVALAWLFWPTRPTEPRPVTTASAPAAKVSEPAKAPEPAKMAEAKTPAAKPETKASEVKVAEPAKPAAPPAAKVEAAPVAKPAAVAEAPKPAPVAEAPAVVLPKPCGDKRGAELDVCLSASAPTIVSADLVPKVQFGPFSSAPKASEIARTNIADCSKLDAGMRDVCISLSLPTLPVEVAEAPKPAPVAEAPKPAPVAEAPAVVLPKPCGDKRGAELDVCLSASAPTIVSADLMPKVEFGPFSAAPKVSEIARTNIADCGKLDVGSRDVCISLSLPTVPVEVAEAPKPAPAPAAEAPKPAPVAEAPAVALPKPCGDMRGAELDVCLSASAPTIVSADLMPKVEFGPFSAAPKVSEIARTNIADCGKLDAGSRDVCISLSVPVEVAEAPKPAPAPAVEAPKPAPVAEAPAVALPKPCGNKRGAELDVCLSASAPTIVSPDLMPKVEFGPFSAAPKVAEPARTNIADCGKLDVGLRDVCISLSLPTVPAVPAVTPKAAAAPAAAPAAAAPAARGTESCLLGSIGSATIDAGLWCEFDGLTFKTGSADITTESMRQVRNIASILKAHPSVKIKIGGYTDNVGDAGRNLRLSQRRAEAVREALVDLGIAGGRVEAEGYGEQHPVASNDTEEGRARNRRIAARVTAK